MNRQPDEQAFLQRARAALDASAERIDEVTSARLRAGRRAALAAPQAHPLRAWVPAWHAAALAAVLAVGAVVVWRLADSPVTGPGIEDADLLTSTESLEMYEDLDFYLWLADQQHSG